MDAGASGAQRVDQRALAELGGQHLGRRPAGAAAEQPEFLEVIVAGTDDTETETRVPAVLDVVDFTLDIRGAVPDLDQIDADRVGARVRHAVVVDLAIIGMRGDPDRALAVREPDRFLQNAAVRLAFDARVLIDHVDRAVHRRMRTAVGLLAGDQQQAARLPQRVIVLIVRAVIGDRQKIQPGVFRLADDVVERHVAGRGVVAKLTAEAAVGRVIGMLVHVALAPLRGRQIGRRSDEARDDLAVRASRQHALGRGLPGANTTPAVEARAARGNRDQAVAGGERQRVVVEAVARPR